MNQAVRYEVGTAGIARLTLDDPASRVNTLHRAMWEQLGEAVRELGRHGDVRGLIVQSAKPNIFVAGADLREIADLPTDDPEPTRALVRRGRDVLATLEALTFPTVAAIDGAALGGGFELALACDYRIAGPNPKVKVGLPEVKLGLIPGWGGTQRPSRLIGLEPAARLVTNGTAIDAQTAHELGLIDGLADAGSLDDLAISTLKTAIEDETWTARRGRKAHAAKTSGQIDDPDSLLAGLTDDQRIAGVEALRVVQEGSRLPLDGALAIEEAAFVPLIACTAARRLIAAFLQR